ncbi:MAG TPA: NnrU family protein [Alphaproteobacteria bacterium]|nr:NnrU family protein [Alphaproteobacteria bacterium]
MLDAFIGLLTAAVAFVGSHFVLAAPRTRATLVKRLGAQQFTALYSLVALVTIVVFAIAYNETPYVELWPSTPALRLVPVIVVLFSAFLILCGLTQRNPTAVNQSFDPAARDPAPGILKVTRHPVMWGIGLWALAHIVANGDLAALIFFGTFAFLALFGTTQIEAKRRAREPDGFARFAEVTSNVPLVALLSTKKRNFWKTAYSIDPLKTVWNEIGLWRVAAALALYVALVFLHPWLTGVAVH